MYVCYRLTVTGVLNKDEQNIDIIGQHHRQTVFVWLQCIVAEKYEKFIKKLVYAQFFS